MRRFAIKPGVDVRGLRPEILPALLAAYDVLGPTRDEGCVITSAVEGKHGPDSLHYEGLALDFRTRHLPHVTQVALASELRSRLGEQYDVVLEEDHLHVEFDPKPKG